MKPRIQQLAEQLGYDWNWTTQVDFGPKEMEKFATLIIQECANIALREDHDPYECILKHFGVTNAIQTD